MCDDSSTADLPAFLQLYRPDDWIAEILNPNQKEVTFKAIDNCVIVKNNSGQLERRCDGLLLYGSDLTFLELKRRSTKGWLSDGINQLLVTIGYFAQNHPINEYKNIHAYICNGQRPLAISGIATELERFKQKTAEILGNNGIILKVDRTIRI